MELSAYYSGYFSGFANEERHERGDSAEELLFVSFALLR
jgi:hypothetical protein